VLSAVALVSAGRTAVRLSRSRVWFRELSTAVIERYCACGEPFDKAGSYAIQGQAALYIRRLEGSYSGVMGLPLFETGELLHTAWEAKKQLFEHVVREIGGETSTMDLRGGRVTGAPRDLTFKQACGLMSVESFTTVGRAPLGLPRFTGEVAGVQFAEVLVDTETGAVRVVKVVAVQDCGLVIDPLTARSQINGGVIQGISYALFEERLLDPRSGDMVNADFLGYKIAGALDTPEIVAIPFSVANGISSTGASSLGEPPTVPTSGAIANAVANALGVRVRSLPITPAKVLAALGGA